MAAPWLSADGIAAHLGVAKNTVYTWISEKGMPAHKVGRLWKFQTSEVDDWVRRGGATASSEPSPQNEQLAALSRRRSFVGGTPYPDPLPRNRTEALDERDV